jgi:hypothetical protein
MTTSNKAGNGDKATAKQAAQREHGLSVLREKEARALISLACDALREVQGVAHEMFCVIYRTDDSKASQEELPNMRDDVLACLSTSEHYLLMLGSVLDDQANDHDTWTQQAPYPVYMTSPEAADGH